MKKFKYFFIFLFMFSFAFLVACGGSKPTKKYTVSFETGCDAVVEAQEVKENEKATKPADPSREGYTFTGWFNGDVEYTFDEAVTSDITLTASWNEIKFTVTFVTDCDETVEPQTIKFNGKATKPADPNKEGFNFLGWFNGEVEYTFEETVTSNVTLTAKWEEIKKYTVKFIVNGEVIDEQIVEEGKSASLPLAPEIEGHVFNKWNGVYTNVTANQEVVAEYNINLYFVEFFVNGVAYGEPVLVEHGSACEAPADPEVEGYEFVAWDTDLSVVKGNLTVNATLEAIQYDIKYYSGETELTDMEPSKYTIEEAVALGSYDVKDYYFYGWYANSDFEGEAINTIALGSTGEVKLYALNVTVEVNGGLDCWETEFPDGITKDTYEGIDPYTNLPEIFEMDFYKYLSDNNLLNSDKLDPMVVASSWEVFSGLNPNHNGDPRRIWNDTATTSFNGAPGYVGLFLYESIQLGPDLTVRNVVGGFLGTEPYKTKYRGLLDVLVILYQYKVENSRYPQITTNTNASRAALGYIIDGYFYGTQGLTSADSYFNAAKLVIPGITYSYKTTGVGVELNEYALNQIPTPVKYDQVFAGWYLDEALTLSIKDNNPTNFCKLYAKWETIQ